MKRFHVHVHVAELEKTIPFYTGLFGAAPTVKRVDYAKWSLDEPAVNFAISIASGGQSAQGAKGIGKGCIGNEGISHLGIEAAGEDELRSLRRRFQAAGGQVLNQEGVSCCYARGNKSWIQDPAGIAWEAFHSISEAAQLEPGFAPDLPPGREVESASRSCSRLSSTGCCG